MARCRLYIDEVGNDDLRAASNNDNERYLSLTGLITKETAYEGRFQPELRQLKVDVFGPGHEGIIFHRREIVRREGVFAVLKDPAIAARFDAGMLRLFKGLPYLVSTVAIDKRAHLDLYGEWTRHPYHYCLVNLIERYVLWMRRHDYTGDVAIEPRNPKPDRAVKEAFTEIYMRGTDHVKPHIIQNHLTSKEIKFIHKQDNCAAMQIVDLIAHPSSRGMRLERLNQPAPEDFGTKVVDILERWKYARHPKSRIRDGWGKKWLPK